VIACTSHGSTDAGVADGSDDEAAVSCPFCDGSAPDAGNPYWPDAIPPPPVACTDAGACPLPPSVCASEQWLEYFDNGTCGADGGCNFDVLMTSCLPGYCIDGGCTGAHITAQAPP
jgi:hypothetical protein